MWIFGEDVGCLLSPLARIRCIRTWCLRNLAHELDFRLLPPVGILFRVAPLMRLKDKFVQQIVFLRNEILLGLSTWVGEKLDRI